MSQPVPVLQNCPSIGKSRCPGYFRKSSAGCCTIPFLVTTSRQGPELWRCTIPFLVTMCRLVPELCTSAIQAPGYPIPRRLVNSPESFLLLRLSTSYPSIPPISTMSRSSPIYVLEAVDRISSNSVDNWVRTLECPVGNGPDGLLARFDEAWSAVAKLQLRPPRALRYLGLELVCFPHPHAFVRYLPTFRVVSPALVPFGRATGLGSEGGRGILAYASNASQIKVNPLSPMNLGVSISTTINP
jgi:hypothetical protein